MAHCYVEHKTLTAGGVYGEVFEDMRGWGHPKR